MNPHREVSFTEASQIDVLLDRGWTLEDGYWRAPEGYPYTTTFTRVTAFEIETFLGDHHRRWPRYTLFERIRRWLLAYA